MLENPYESSLWLDLLIFVIYRVNISWNEAAAQCKGIGGHLPFMKRYLYESNSHDIDYGGYVGAMGIMAVATGEQGFGDMTFMGLVRQVITSTQNE